MSIMKIGKMRMRKKKTMMISQGNDSNLKNGKGGSLPIFTGSKISTCDFLIVKYDYDLCILR